MMEEGTKIGRKSEINDKGRGADLSSGTRPEALEIGRKCY